MISNEEKQVLSDLVTTIERLDLTIMIVGAGARLLIFDSKFGEGRGTKDWDVAVSIDTWEAYDKIGDTLINSESPCFQRTKTRHKFIHIETNIEVDIVPFGKISEPNKEIIWSDNDNSMNVSGFDEALSNAKNIDITDDLEIKVIDIPAFVVLKIFAWDDRKDRTKKDLEDIDFILSNYEDDNRVYEELAEELADGVVEYLDASIYLLGQDISRIFQTKTLHNLSSLLEMLINDWSINISKSLRSKLEVLKKGIDS